MNINAIMIKSAYVNMVNMVNIYGIQTFCLSVVVKTFPHYNRKKILNLVDNLQLKYL